MASPATNDPDRAQLEELSAALRDATFAALQKHSLVAASLDESRSEVDRLLMLDERDPLELRRVINRARILLDAWRNLSGVGSARSR
ncbi:MAG TPA: hypothetical protein VF334_21210 [Polyangia bacterium]